MKNARLSMLILVATWLFMGCSSGNSPEQAAKEWMDGIVNQDGNKTIKYTCLDQRDDVQTATMWFSAFSVLGQMLTNRSVQIKGDVSDLKFETITQTEDRAEVRVFGELRSAVLGSGNAQQIDERWQMVREDSTWRWCGNITPELAEEIAYEATSSALSDQRDATPPAGDEQIAAAKVFQQYAQEILSIQYRNAQYETISNDGTFAEVVITAEGWDSTNQAWLEFNSSVINLRLVGGEWKADTSDISIALTDNGQAALKSTQESATKATAETLGTSHQANLGGTLIYISDYERTAVIINPDGSESTIQFDILGEVEFIKFAPDKSGFYFSGIIRQRDVKNNLRLYYYDFETKERRLIYQAEPPSLIHDFSISPDNTKMAIAGSLNTEKTSGAEDGVWIVPINGGEAFKLKPQNPQFQHNLDSNTLLWSPIWSLDSQSLYGIVLQQRTLSSIWEIPLDGTVRKVADLPQNAIDGTPPKRALALSPNGEEIAFGADWLGLVRISNGSTIPLQEINDICNMTWSPDGDRLVFLSSNKVLFFDIASGQLTNPYNLLLAHKPSNTCAVAFDWIP